MEKGNSICTLPIECCIEVRPQPKSPCQYNSYVLSFAKMFRVHRINRGYDSLLFLFLFKVNVCGFPIHAQNNHQPTNQPTNKNSSNNHTKFIASDFFQEHWEFPQIKSTALFVHSIYSLMVFIYFYMVPSRSMWAVFWRRIKDENKNIGIWNKQRKSYSVQA